MRHVIYSPDGYYDGPYVEFADGTRIPVRGEVGNLILRLYANGAIASKRPEEIADVEELATILEQFCQERATTYASLAKRVRSTLLPGR
ncbi:MAG: hypothetical protein M0Z94_03270 [Dehalococcoidales bacterium]|nr:hypothetical protein [Dehalococcoidales bacterium]